MHGFDSSIAGTWFHLLEDPCFLCKVLNKLQKSLGYVSMSGSGQITKARQIRKQVLSAKYRVWQVSNSEACSPKVKVLFVPFHLLLVQPSSYGPLFECSKSLRTNQHLNIQGQTQVWPLATYWVYSLYSLFCWFAVPLFQWPFQVPKLGVLCHIKPYFGGYIPLHSPY